MTSIIVLFLGALLLIVGVIAIIRKRISVGGRLFRVRLEGVSALLIAVPQALVGAAMLVVSGAVLLGVPALEPFVNTALWIGVVTLIATNGLGLILHFFNK